MQLKYNAETIKSLLITKLTLKCYKRMTIVRLVAFRNNDPVHIHSVHHSGIFSTGTTAILWTYEL